MTDNTTQTDEVEQLPTTPIADGGEYETYTIDANERRVFSVDDGETFENVVFDCTASGAKAIIDAHGTNQTIRNIAWKGYIDDGSADALIGISDTGGGTTRLENVYIGDGGADGSDATALTGIWVNPAHSGHLDIVNVHIAEMSDNAFYCSAPGSSGNGGTITIDHCYALDNGISGFRIGDGGLIVDSVAEVTNDAPHHSGRGIWAWGTDNVEVRRTDVDTHGNSHALVAGAHSGGPRVDAYEFEYRGTIRETNGGNFVHHSGADDPDTTPPEGVPMSVEDVFDGDYEPPEGSEPSESVGNRHDGLGHTLEFEGTGEYFFETRDGSIELSGVDGEPADEHDDVYIDGTRASGVLDDSSHVFEFDEFMADVSGPDDDVEITIDGSYEPSYDIYPTGDSDGRDWLADVPWHDDDDGGDDENGDNGDDDDDDDSDDSEQIIDELKEDIAYLEDRLEDTESDLADALAEKESLEDRLEDKQGWFDQLGSFISR